MADAAKIIEIPGGKQATKIPIDDNDLGKVHTFTVPLKNGDAPNAPVALHETDTSETLVAHLRPGESRNLRLGKAIYCKSAAASGLSITPITEPTAQP